MNGVAFRHALRSSFRTSLIVSVALGLFYWVILLSSASFLDASDQTLPEFLREPPKVMQAFLGGSADFLSPIGWLSTGTLHPIVLTLTAIGAFMVVTGTGATELERGTIELVLVRPIGRTPYVLARAAAGLVLLTIVELGGFGGTLVARATVSGVGTLPVGGIALTFAGHLLLFAGFGMIALLVFSTASLRSRALGLSIGIVVGAFFVNFVSLLFDSLTWLGYLSPFHYFSAAEILERRASAFDWIVLAAVALGAGALAVHLFARRDLSR